MKIYRAIIGGIGFSELEDFELLDTFSVETPYGYPSNPIQIGKYKGHIIAFLSRYSKNRIQNIPNRANIYALKLLDIQQIISLDMVGILSKKIHLMDVILPYQVVDMTRSKKEDQSFFEDLPILINFSNPICQNLYNFLFFILKGKFGQNFHHKKVYYGVDGLFFSTIAESLLYQSWGADIIGIDIVTEMKLAKQVEICYIFFAFASDYDACFLHKRISSNEIFQIIKKNLEQFYQILFFLLKEWENLELSCSCQNGMKNILSKKVQKLPESIQRNIKKIHEKYFI